MAMSKLQFAEVDSGSLTSHTLVAAPGAGKRLIIVGLDLKLGAAQTFSLLFGTTPLAGDMPAVQEKSYEIVTLETGYVERWRGAENEAFNLNVGVATTVDGVVWYLTEDV